MLQLFTVFRITASMEISNDWIARLLFILLPERERFFDIRPVALKKIQTEAPQQNHTIYRSTEHCFVEKSFLFSKNVLVGLELEELVSCIARLYDIAT